MAMTSRDRAVYARQTDALKHQIAQSLDAAHPAPVEGEIYALVVPNTNLLGGARVAAEAYKLLEGRHVDTVVLVAPSPIGAFQRMNICTVDAYPTPLGTLNVNDRMRHELCDEDDDIYLDDSGHFDFQGIGVQLPYLQTVLGAFDIVPVVMGDESPEFCRELGLAIGEITYNHRALVVASADVGAATDEHLSEFKALIQAADVSRLMALLNSERVQMVGRGPLLVALIAAQHRHAGNVRILGLEPSRGEAPGYVGAVLWR